MPTANELEKFSKKIQNGEVPATQDVSVVAPSSTPEPSIIDDDDVVIAGMDTDELKEEAASTVPVVNTAELEIAKTVEEHLQDFAKADPVNYAKEKDTLINDLIDHRRKLVIESGLTEEEATTAVKRRAIKKADELNAKYSTAAAEPGVAVVKIDKTQADKVEFTDEEKTKMSKAKAIRLVEVEDSSLLTIPIKSNDSDDVLFTAIHRAS